ncbi:MAG TPA: DinB family protein, partial [Phototrophicaceae bacterium]|nr:DinB family protein [Phototrophicaceae bacterium]
SVKMELSERPKPEIPATIDDLVAKMTEANATAVRELRELVADVPEELLSQRPEPGEWSVNEVLSHLIWSETHSQVFAWAVYGGDDYVPWPANNPMHLAKALAVYPTSGELLDELERNMKSSVAMVRTISEEFTENRANYAVIASNWNGSLQHIQTHHNQIKNAIEAAKAMAVG